MEGYLQQIVQCALSKVLIDKLSYIEDICFSVDVNIVVDRTETFRFFVNDRILKTNASLYQEQFALLIGDRSAKQSQTERRDVGTQWEKHTEQSPDTLCQTDTIQQSYARDVSYTGQEADGSIMLHTTSDDDKTPTSTSTAENVEEPVDTQKEDDGNGMSKDQIEGDKVEKNSAAEKGNITKKDDDNNDDNDVDDFDDVMSISTIGNGTMVNNVETTNGPVLVDAEVQTEETRLRLETKRRPRKAGTQQKKSKRNSEVSVTPVEIKTENDEDGGDQRPFSDPGSDVEETMVVPALPPSEPQTAKPNSELITCPLCPSVFKSQQGAESHLRIKHDIGNVYICTFCQEVCPSHNALTQHQLDAHGTVDQHIEPEKPKKKRGRKPKAAKVAKVAKSALSQNNTAINRTIKRGKKNLSVVIKTTNTKTTNIKTTNIKTSFKGKGIQKCPDCPKEYSSRRALMRHIKTVHEAKRYQCDICGKIFTSKETLYHHRRGIHSDKKPYQCEECGASFNFNHSLRLHRLKHSGVRPHECKECHKTYLTSNHLKMHMQGVHKEKKSHSCHICGKAFSYTTSLKVHIMTHGDIRPYKCNVCGQGFVNSHSLKYHRESKHSSNTWFDCDVCGKKYKTEFLMKTHRRRHTPDGQRYMCDICGRQFMYKSTLEIHAAVHSDEKSFQCTQCGKSFKTYATLYSHQYVHKADSPFKCPDCGKAFKTKERCKAHQRRHSGLKPFECDLCGRCFPDKGGLTKHTKTVHCDVKKFVCGVCGKACSRGDNLRVHMKIHNKGSDSTVNVTSGKRSKGRSANVASTNDLESPSLKIVFNQNREGSNLTPESSTPGGDSMLTNISSPNISPPPSMAPLPRAYQDRLDPPPFIPNADNITVPSALNLHAAPLTTQESDINSLHGNPVTLHPGNSTNPMIPSSLPQMPSVSSYMYQMWPYLHPHTANQQASDNGNPYY